MKKYEEPIKILIGHTDENMVFMRIEATSRDDLSITGLMSIEEATELLNTLGRAIKVCVDRESIN